MNAHGGSQFQAMLQLLEGYLDKKDVADEARYDKVREGAIVFLGTLARHLDPSDAKVPFRSSILPVNQNTCPLMLHLCLVIWLRPRGALPVCVARIGRRHASFSRYAH